MPDAPATKWMIISLNPDVCVTKGVPVPYVIVSEWEAAELYSGNVAYNGCLSMTVKSITRECKGDEAGDAGMQSGTVGGTCKMLDKSESVRINGANAVRQGDQVWMNNGNTKGKFLIIPAVAKSSELGALKGAAFNLAVAQLVEKLEAEGDGIGKLYQERNPQPDDGSQDLRVANNPVIVAAEYYFQAKAKVKQWKGGYFVREWEYAKKCGPTLMYWLATSKWSLVRLRMNENQPPSEWDDQFAYWMAQGWKAGGGENPEAIAAFSCPPPPPPPKPRRIPVNEIDRINQQRAERGQLPLFE